MSARFKSVATRRAPAAKPSNGPDASPPKAVRFPLSAHQQARFAELRAQKAALQQQLADVDKLVSEAVTAIVSATHDPSVLSEGTIALTETEIVCTPKDVKDAKEPTA